MKRIYLTLITLSLTAGCLPEGSSSSNDPDGWEFADDAGGVGDAAARADASADATADAGPDLGEDAGLDTGEACVPSGEVCDGQDNDCDGATDEGCACDFDDAPTGVCAGATRDDLGACATPEGYERNESLCDGKDNDCDGSTDENCTCVFDGVDVGVCASGVLSMGQCDAPATYEADEVACDGADNDCDGATDEGCACDFDSIPAGVCGAASRDDLGACAQPATYEADEVTCDGADNDCDGATDEGCACDFDGRSDGVCSDGALAMDGSCSAPGDYEAVETFCDGDDNDCDGTTDEGCTCDFDGSGVGVCSDGALAMDGSCGAPGDYEADEVTCDGDDNDCDGVTDEGCACDFNGTPAGVCAGSTIDPATGACASPASYEPMELSCDGLDNDCDGAPDGPCPAPGDLVVTEFMANPVAVNDARGEWIELYNASGRALSLRGLVVKDSNNALTLMGDPVVPAGGYFIIGQDGDPSLNGGVTVDYVHSSFFLNNTMQDSITLEQDARAGGATLDTLSYDWSTWPMAGGRSTQLDPSLRDATSNDSSSAWCLGSAPMSGGDQGTPRADNPPCAP